MISRKYYEVLACHCAGKNVVAPVENDPSHYQCSHCGWNIRLVMDKAPARWYLFEDNDDPSLFPQCMDCGKPTEMANAGYVEEEGHYFKGLIFICASQPHGERVVSGYSKEISQQEYWALTRSREEIISTFVAEILMGGIDGNNRNVSDRNLTESGSTIDLTSLPEKERLQVIELYRALERCELVRNFRIAEGGLFFLMEEDFRRALVEAVAARKLKSNGCLQ